MNKETTYSWLTDGQQFILHVRLHNLLIRLKNAFLTVTTQISRLTSVMVFSYAHF